jgi:hypothetical protein
MGAVAGAPTGHTSDEAEQTSQALDRAPPTAGQAQHAGEQTPQAPDRAPPTAGQAQHAVEQAPEQAPRTPEQAPQAPEQSTEQAPGFGERGRMRRRARFLRKARELAYRDLGGLVFDLHRFGQRNDQLVLLKLATLRQIDTELRELEEVLRDRRPVTVLREVGIAACPRCAAIHGSDDRFCPGCGLAFDTHADRPISTAPVHAQPRTPAPAAQPPPATPTAPTPVTVSPPPLKPPSAKPTAAPVAAKPASPPASPEREPDRAEEDEPTRVLRPPAGA